MSEKVLPLGALKLGCRNCRPRDGRHDYCSSCPVTLRQKDGKPWRIERKSLPGREAA